MESQTRNAWKWKKEPCLCREGRRVVRLCLAGKRLKDGLPFRVGLDTPRQVITWERASLLTVKGYWAQYKLTNPSNYPSIHPATRRWGVRRRLLNCKWWTQKCHKQDKKCQVLAHQADKERSEEEDCGCENTSMLTAAITGNATHGQKNKMLLPITLSNGVLLQLWDSVHSSVSVCVCECACACERRPTDPTISSINRHKSTQQGRKLYQRRVKL